MDFLPSKRFGITAVFILAAFAGWFFVFGPGNKPQNSQTIVSNESLIAIENTPSEAAPTTDQKTPTDISEEYLRLEGVVFPPSRVAQMSAGESESADLKAYGVALGKALKPYSSSSRQNEVALALTALEKGNAKSAAGEVASLKAAVKIHTQVEEGLIALKVPESLVELHAELITAVARMKQLAVNLSEPFDDAVLALASVGEYKTESAAVKTALVSINEEFTKAGITFSDTEKMTVVLYEVQ